MKKNNLLHHIERSLEVQGLELWCHLGVPEKERAQPQRLLCDLRYWPLDQSENLPDELTATIDYAAVTDRLKKIAEEKPYQLLEVLADHCANKLLAEFSIEALQLKIRKFILPGTDCVATHLFKSRKP